MNDQPGSGKSNTAAAKPEVSANQLTFVVLMGGVKYPQGHFFDAIS